MVLVSIIIAVKTEHPEKLVMFIPSIPTFSGLNEELSYNVIPRVPGGFSASGKNLFGDCSSIYCFFITWKLYQSRLCTISTLGFVHIAVRLLFGPLRMYAQKDCGGITTLAWHNNYGHSLILRLYLAIIASNDCPEYVYHTMSSITDFNSCSTLGFLGSQLVVNGQSVVKFPLVRLRRSTPTL